MVSGSELGRKEEKERHTVPFSQWEDHIFHCPGKHCTLLGVVEKRAPSHIRDVLGQAMGAGILELLLYSPREIEFFTIKDS